MKPMEWVKKNILQLTLIIGLLIMGILYFQQCKNIDVAKKKLEVAEHNINALNDTIRITKTKDGTIEFDKLAFLTDKVSNLEKLNSNLASAVRNIKGNVSTIISGEVKIETDTLYLPAKTVVQGDVIATDFKLDTNYSQGNSRNFAGYTLYDTASKVSRAVITKDSMNIAFITGIKNLDKGKPEIYLLSKYPGFTATSLSGAVLDPKLFQPKNKQKLITVGVNIGYTPITYSVGKQKLDFDPTRFGGSVGVNINLFRLFKNNGN